MNTQLLEKIEKPYMKKVRKFNVGDTVTVKTIVREGEKTRIQAFKGIVLAIKGSGTRKTFTVRKIATNGIGVEKIFPLYSPNIESIELIKKGKVRRSKLYYMSSRVGKKAMKIADSDKPMVEEYEGYDEEDMKEQEEEKSVAETTSDSEEKKAEDSANDDKKDTKESTNAPDSDEKDSDNK